MADYLFTCETCRVRVVEKDHVGCWENNTCEECEDKRIHEEWARMKPLWEAERRQAKQYEDLDSYKDMMRDAGRGHLLKG